MEEEEEEERKGGMGEYRRVDGEHMRRRRRKGFSGDAAKVGEA